MTPTSTPTSTPVNFTHVSFFDIHNLLNVTFVLCFTECELDKWFIARPTFTCLILVLLFILYLYVAIVHYPAYRCNKHITRRNARTASLEDTSQNRLVYVIVFPFALIYISLRIAWELYRQCVFYSLDTIEFVIRLVPRGLAVLWRNYLRIVMKTIVHVMKTIVLGTWYIIRSILRTSVRAIWKSLIFGYNAIWKTCAYSWNTIKRSCVYVWRDVGKRLLFAICINPTKWAIRRGIYLSRIACYVACFIIRDMLEDVRDLVFLGCDSSRRIWNSTIVPAGHVAYHAIAYSRATVRVYGSKVRAHLYKRVFIAGTSELTWIVGEVLRDPILRYVAETGYGTIRRAKFCLSFMAVSMKQCVTQGLYAMQRLLSQALYFIQRLLSQALYFIQRLLSQALYFIQRLLSQALYFIQRLLSQALYFIQRLLSQALYSIQRLLSRALYYMQRLLSQALYSIQRLLSRALYYMQRLLSQALYSIQRLLSQALYSIQRLLYFALYFLKQLLSHSLYFLKQHVSQGLYSMKRHMSQGLYTAISFLCELSVDSYVNGLWLYHNILAPLIRIIPATLDLMLQFAYTMYTGLRIVCDWLYFVIKNILFFIFNMVLVILLKPAYKILEMVYVGLVRPCSLTLFKLGKAVFSLSMALILYSWSHIQTLFISLYNILSSFFNVISVLFIAFYNVMLSTTSAVIENTLLAIRYMSGIIYTPVIWLAQFYNELYDRYEPVVVNNVAAIAGTVDNAVVAVGDAMMEWVKREQELREAIRGR